MTTLVGDVVELAREDEGQAEPIEVRLDILVARAVERARRRAPSMTFDVELTPGSVRGSAGPPRAGRAQRPRQRGQMESASRHHPDPAAAPAGVDARRPRSRTGHRGSRPSSCVRPFLPGGVGPVPARLGLGPGHRAAGGHQPTAGSVQVNSPPGGGTLVHIELPIVVEHEPAEVAGDPGASADHPAGAGQADGGSRPAPAPARFGSFGPDPGQTWPARPGAPPGPAPAPNPYGDPAAPWEPDEDVPADAGPGRSSWFTRRP